MSLGLHARVDWRDIPETQNGGFFLAIVGPDGSGKTTIADGIMSFWQENFNKVPLCIHGGFAVLPRLKYLRKLWAWIRGGKLAPDPDYTKRHSGANVMPHSLFKSLLYVGYYYWGYMFGHFKVSKAKSEDNLIVADRYFYDYFYQRGNMKLPHWLLRLLSWFIPQPDLIVYLEREPKSIYNGKDELTLAEIERQQTILDKLIKDLPHAVRVNGDKGIEATVREIRHHILSKMAVKNS